MIIHNVTYTEVCGSMAVSIDITYTYINNQLEIKAGSIVFDSFAQTIKNDIDPENYPSVLNKLGYKMRRTAINDIAKLKETASLDAGHYEKFHAIQKERAHYDS